MFPVYFVVRIFPFRLVQEKDVVLSIYECCMCCMQGNMSLGHCFMDSVTKCITKRRNMKVCHHLRSFSVNGNNTLDID